MKSILVQPPQAPVRAVIRLASSKSESNRALILNALAGFRGQLSNVSEARDTQTMLRLLNAGEEVVADVIDAGTTMRFLTAFFSVTGQRKKMTGTPRMCQRPIGILVDALRKLGADIAYEKSEGCPPLALNGFNYSGVNSITIRGDVSSQYISALLMIAPTLPEGMELTLQGAVGSRPYIEMTLKQMEEFGIAYEADWEKKVIRIAPQEYQPADYAVESDWSGASYWYSIVAILPDAEVELLGLKEQSLQGDSAIVQIMEQLGVKSTFNSRGVLLQKQRAAASLDWDFTDCPDLAQTVAACCAAKNIGLSMTGVESLKIKETDRILALQQELRKLGSDLVEVEMNHRYELRRIHALPVGLVPVIDTYDDHRMAMAFAPVGMLTPVLIEEPMVVVKSYPGFWKDLGSITELKEDAAHN